MSSYSYETKIEAALRAFVKAEEEWRAQKGGMPKGTFDDPLSDALKQAKAALKARDEYARRNPLGGPAKVFEAMAARIRAGEEYYSVLDDYQFSVKKSPDGPRVPLSPNVDGQDFYELCQAYRHSQEIAPHPNLPNTVQAFNAIRDYIKTGRLPWPSYERGPDGEATALLREIAAAGDLYRFNLELDAKVCNFLVALDTRTTATHRGA